jgi:thiol-disulfide isomerase/thioredoxin
MRKAYLVVLAVAGAAALGFFAQHWLDGDGQPAVGEAATVQAGASAEPAAEPLTDAAAAAIASETAPAPVIPDALPRFQLADREGRMRSLQDWAGRPLMVNYWATWCAPCRREIPLLNALRSEGLAPKLEVIGIAVDFRDDVLAYAGETPIDYPLLIGEEDGLEAVQLMGMHAAFPFTVFADSQQRILTVKVGELHRDEAELILARLAAVDGGRETIAQAKTKLDTALKDLATLKATKEGVSAAKAASSGTVPAG